METSYTTVSGHTVDLSRAGADALAFLDRMRALAEKPGATEADVIGLAYARENPFLAEGPFPGRGTVTQAVLELPAYHVLGDIIARKRLADDHVDLDALAAEHSLSVSEFAGRVGISAGAVRQAIAAGRLASWVKGGHHWMRPAALASYKLEPRGPQPKTRKRSPAGSPLLVCTGNGPGSSFRVRHPGKLADREHVGTRTVKGTIPTWQRVGVITSDGERHRFFELVPATRKKVIVSGEFSIVGRFEIAREVTGGRAAAEAWSTFKAQ